MLDLQTISDRIEIDDLITSYTRSVDTLDWERFVTVFTDDAVIDHTASGGQKGTRDEIRDWLAETLPMFSAMQHYVAQKEVHLDGEVYGAIGWRLWKNFQNVGRSADEVLAILVNGMNYTPQQPRFEDMRDGILAGLTTNADRCLVWEAFAHYCVGVGAKGKDQGKKASVAESFAVPAACQAQP